MKHRLLIIIGLLYIFSVVQAQDNFLERIQFLNEDEIFTDSVEIIERRAIVRAFDDTRKIYYFDPDELNWNEYDYPRQMQTIYNIQMYSDTEILLRESFDAEPSSMRLLNVETGELSFPERRCGEVTPLNNFPRWKFYENSICNTGTLDAYSIPQNVFDAHTETQNTRISCGTMDSAIDFSPDNDYLIFGTCEGRYNRLYRYDLETETTELIFSIEGTQTLNILAWRDNHILFFETRLFSYANSDQYSEPVGSKLHVLDTRTHESRTIAYASLDVQRRVPEDIANSLDFTTSVGQVDEYFMLGIRDNHLLAQTYDFQNDVFDTVFDMNCDDLLFPCETVSLWSTSPDEDYFVIHSINPDPNVHILSTENNSVIYTGENASTFSRSIWINEHQYVWMEYAPLSSYDGMQIFHRVTLSETHEILADDIFEAVTYSDDGSYITIYETDARQTTVSIQNIETGETYSIMTVPASIGIRVTFLENDDLRVQLYEEFPIERLAQWTIRLMID